MRLLFVCVENSCRSQMAEAFARLHGAGTVEAYSAGSCPAPAVDPRTRALMRERGVDLGSQAPKDLAALPPGVIWDWVVTMGCGEACPPLPALGRADWDLPDPKGLPDDEFRRVRDEIEQRVRALLATCGAP